MKIPVALEISEKYLKVTAAKLAGTHMKVSNCAVELISNLTPEQITQLLQDNFQKWKIKPRSLLLSLSRNLVTVRNLHLPSQDKQEITQMIDLNVARMVPYKRDEIIFSYKLLGSDEMGYSQVILAIVKNDSIRKQIKIIESAGYPIDSVTLSSCGVFDWCYNNARSEINQTDLYLLLDIDSAFSDFIIFSNNNLLFSRSINVGAETIISDKETGMIKILGEVKQSLIMFYNEEINKKPAAAFISGAGIKSDLLSTLEAELGIPIKMLPNPCPPDSINEKSDIAKNVSLSAVGEFACRDQDRSINFNLPEIQIRKSLREKTRDIIILGSFCIYLFTLLCVSFFGKIQNQQNYLAKLNKQYSNIEAEFRDKIDRLSKIELVKKQLRSRETPMFVISQLQKVLPDDIVLTSVNIDEQNKASLRGQAVQLADVFRFSGILDKVDHFKNVQEKSTRKKRVKDKDLTEFEIVFNVEL